MSSYFEGNTFTPEYDTDFWDSSSPEASAPSGGAFDYTPISMGQSSSEPAPDLGAPAPDRFPNMGVELTAPDTSGMDNRLFPFGGGEWNPRTVYNFWNPMSAYDTIGSWARAFIPGVQEAGDTMAEIGRNIANSDFGTTLSGSPVAGAANLVGGAIGSIFKGGLMVAGDMLSPIGDSFQLAMNKDFGGAILNALRIGPVNLGIKTSDRIVGMMDGDEGMREELFDELGFLAILATGGLGATTAIGRQVAGAGIKQIGKGVVKSGLYDMNLSASGVAAYSQSPGLATALSIAHRTMAGGYGLMLGGEISSRLLGEDVEDFNVEMAKGKLIPDESPFRGPVEFGAGMLVDPFPMLGKIGNSEPMRKLLDSGYLRLPAPAEQLFQWLKPGQIKLTDDMIREFSADLAPQVARRRLEKEGNHFISESQLETEIQQLMGHIEGSGGTASDYSKTYFEMRQELLREIHDMSGLKKFKGRVMTTDDVIEAHQNYRRMFGVLDEAEAPLIANGMKERHLLVRSETLVDADIRPVQDYVRNLKTFGDDIPAAEMDNIKGQWKEVWDELDGANKTSIMRQLDDLERQAPKEAHGLLEDAAKMVRSQGDYKVIVKGNRPVINSFDQIPFDHPIYRDLKRILGKELYDKNIAGGKPLGFQAIKDLVEGEGKKADVLHKWLFDDTAYYTHTRSDLVRPLIRPRSDLEARMPKGATFMGRYVAGFREWIPNLELAGQFKEKFYRTHMERVGADRDQIDQYLTAIDTILKATNAQHKGQAIGFSPFQSGDALQKAFRQIFGDDAGTKFRAAQLMEESMPREGIKQFIKIMTGQDTGAVGVVGSFMSKVRSQNTGGAGDFYRWWANVGHPMLRYDLSVTFRLQLPFESAVLNFVKGTAFAPYDQFTRAAVNEMTDDALKMFAGKSGGERMKGSDLIKEQQRNFQLSSEAAAADITSGRSNVSETILQGRVDYMKKYIEVVFPEYFARQLEAANPAFWKTLKEQYRGKSDRYITEQMLYERDVVNRFLKGELSVDDARDLSTIFRKNYNPSRAALPAEGHFTGYAEDLDFMKEFAKGRFREVERAGHRYVPVDKGTGWEVNVPALKNIENADAREWATWLSERSIPFKIDGDGLTIMAGDRDFANALTQRFKMKHGQHSPIDPPTPVRATSKGDTSLITGMERAGSAGAKSPETPYMRHNSASNAAMDPEARYYYLNDRRVPLGKDRKAALPDEAQSVITDKGLVLWSNTKLTPEGPKFSGYEVKSKFKTEDSIYGDEFVSDSKMMRSDIGRKFAEGMPQYNPALRSRQLLSDRYGAYFTGTSGTGVKVSNKSLDMRPLTDLNKGDKDKANALGIFSLGFAKKTTAEKNKIYAQWLKERTAEYAGPSRPHNVEKNMAQMRESSARGPTNVREGMPIVKAAATAGKKLAEIKRQITNQGEGLPTVRMVQQHRPQFLLENTTVVQGMKGEIKVPGSKRTKEQAPAEYNKNTQTIYYDEKRIADDWKNWDKSWLASKNQDNIKKAFGMDLPTFRKYLEDHGGANAYRDFILEHEITHAIMPQADEGVVFLEATRRFQTRNPGGMPTVQPKPVQVDLDSGYSLAAGMRNKDAAQVAVEAFDVIKGEVRSAMEDAVRQAQTVHISNPTRRYWERSLSHPMVMYPLSWTLKAAGEWSSFLGHSMFGLKTGMGGLVLWEDIKDGTLKALANDPDALKWAQDHPATIKLIEYMIPGSPLGVGFGLLSMPLRDTMQLGWNYWHGKPLDSNMTDLKNIGAIRDFNFGDKLYSEWALGKPKTSLDNPGLTSGRRRMPQGLDAKLEPSLRESIESRK